MALFKFTEAILQGQPIDIYNHGQMARDFTYIDDIVEGIARLCPRPPIAEREGEGVNKLFNIGRGKPIALLVFVECLETALGIKAQYNLMPMQAGDVISTWADVSALEKWTGFLPKVDIQDGVSQFVSWYRDYYKVPIAQKNFPVGR